jgi:hypothetical protein
LMKDLKSWNIHYSKQISLKEATKN